MAIVAAITGLDAASTPALTACSEPAAGTLRGAMSVALAPDDVVRTHAEASANSREPLLVLDPLIEFLDANKLDAPPDLSATPIGEGHSNVTFELSTGVVLRRPPRGPLPPSAHDVLREARLLRALGPTPVRVPTVLAVCDDERVVGAPFYLMSRIEGQALTTSLPEPLDNPEQRERVADELIDALVELHSVQWTTIGLEGFGKPTGYLERQLRRFTGLWEHNRTRDVPEVEQVGAWLAENMPSSPRPRLCTATIGSATRCTPARRRRGCSRSSTGRWPQSAIPWPTSAT